MPNIRVALLLALAFMLTALPIRAVCGDPVLSSRHISQNYPVRNYELDVRYPILRGKKAKELNRYIRRLINAHLAAYKQGQSDDAKDGPPGKSGRALSFAGTKGYDAINYETAIASKSLVCLRFTEESFPASGAAHPNHTSFTVNYDLVSQRPLTLSDLFATPNYPKMLSVYCVSQLLKNKEADAQWTREGAGSLAKNFASWTLTPKGIAVQFDQYQVASYAEGPKTVVIPYAALSLKPGLRARIVQLTR